MVQENLGEYIRSHMGAFDQPDMTQKVSFGFAMGTCSGYAFRKVGKGGAVFLGLTFIAVQGASTGGYFKVDYKKIEDDIKDLVSWNERKETNLITYATQTLTTFEKNLPAGSGYAAGFALGFRMA